jgi:hypothetical protein
MEPVFWLTEFGWVELGTGETEKWDDEDVECEYCN